MSSSLVLHFAIFGCFHVRFVIAFCRFLDDIEQDEGHQTAMGEFRDVITKLMWTYRNQN